MHCSDIRSNTMDKAPALSRVVRVLRVDVDVGACVRWKVLVDVDTAA